jgi:Ras GTPase-activating protein 1
MSGDFYIGGRQFDTLSDLIGYYTKISYLLKGEQLVTPVPPPEVSLINLYPVQLL